MTLAVVAGRLAMDPLWGRQQNRHLVFLPAVMLAAWLFGFGPGLLSAMVSVAALGCFWLGPGSEIRANFELVLFFVIGAAICLLIRSLQHARDRADAARVSRERVLAVVAHDLRTPLATIMMTSSLLRDRTLAPEQVNRRLKAIDRAALRMENLIRDLVDTAGLERGELSLTVQPEPIDSVIQDAIDLHAPLAQEAGVRLQVELPRRPVVIPCDRKRLLQVLENLLGNALKFTAPGGSITIRVQERDQEVSIAVEDTGSGIAPEHLSRVFDRYWNNDPRGIGLGLYIARSIVRAHGGDIAVRSTPGQGTSFVVTLPRARQAEPARVRRARRLSKWLFT